MRLRKSVIYAVFMMFSLYASHKAVAQVSLTFSNGYLGVQGSNTNQADNIKNLSTLGIARVSFGQPYSSTFGGTQGNDLAGIIKIYLAAGATSPQAVNAVITLNGALNWREISSGNTIQVFGFIFDIGQNASITYNSQTHNIAGGSTAATSSTLGLKAYSGTFTFVDGENRSGNAATNGLLDALNAELASSPHPSTITLTNPSVIEGNNLIYNVTLSSTTTNPQALTFTTSGTASATTRYNTTYTFSNGVVNNGDGTITIPTGVSSFTITIITIDDLVVEPTQTVILNVGNVSATGSILDNDGPSITTSGTLSAFSTCISTASVSQSFTITGSNLTANLNVTVPTGYEIALTQSGTFSNTITISNSGTVSATSIWVRLTGAAAGTYTGSINITSTNASTQTVAVSGTVSAQSVAGTITANNSTICAGSSVTLTLSGYTGSIQWQTSTDNSTFTDITSANNASYITTNVTVNTYYRAVVTSGACSAANTAAKLITVNPTSVAGTISGGDVLVCAGTANSTTLSLSGNTGTIQWQSSSDNSTFTNITGATNASYTATNVSVIIYYRALVTSGVCSAATSASVAITASQCIVANPDINATNVNTIVNGNVNTNDKTTAGSTYGTPTPSSTNPTGGVLTLNTDGTYTFTSPNPGKYIYYIPVCAANKTTGCAITTLEISVNDPNSTTNPPLAKNDYTTSQLNTPVNVKVLSNDKVANPNTTLLPNSITVVAAPANGTAAVNTTTGVITFTPNTGFTGTDSLNYNVCDNASPANCQVATVYFKVSSNAVAEYTTADDDFNTVNMNSSTTGNVLTNDVNSANNELTVTNFSTPLSTQGTININVDGTYTFTPTANFYGPLDITYTACTSGSVCATATLHILVSPVKPAAPKANGGTYTSKDPNNPTTISSTVTNIPNGSKVIYCDVNGLNCANTAPDLPVTPGIYIWCVKSLDTISNLTSSPCVYDTITILPYVKTLNATYVNGVTTNPRNIAGLVADISTGSTPKWCDVNGNNCTITAPLLPTVTGRYIWCVKAVDGASGLVSAICKMDTVNILDPYTVLEISKTAKSIKLNPDGSVLMTFVMNASNKTDAVLDSVSIKDDLTATFNTSTGIIVYSLDVYGGLIKNTGYDGIANIDLVTPASKIAAKKTDSVVLRVLLESPTVFGNLTNIATLAGKSNYGKLSVLSNDPILNVSDSTRRVPTGFVIPKLDLVIAGGFSPNQDGLNDKWIIIRPFGTRVEVQVFNRWGNIVYQNVDYKNDWIGKGESNFMGEDIPDGTYFYIVNAIDPTGAIKKFTSSLTIVR